MNLFTALNTALSGRKTYLVAGVLAIAMFCLQMGWITKETYDMIFGVLIPAGLATLRAGVK